MLTIGLTGGIGSGKSTVANWFKSRGVPVIDADQTVHDLFEADAQLISRLVQEFGAEISSPDGGIERRKLGQIVFSDPDARKRLEEIVHPRVRESMGRSRDELAESGVRLCVWDVPLLFETGFSQYVDQVWVVWVPREVQVERVLARDALTLPEVEARLQAQWPLAEKRRQADVVSDNSGTRQDTIHRLEEAWVGLQNHI